MIVITVVIVAAIMPINNNKQKEGKDRNEILKRGIQSDIVPINGIDGPHFEFIK